MAEYDWVTCDTSREEQEVFGDPASALALDGELINANGLSSLTRVRVAGRGYYVKAYGSAGRWLRRHLGRSRARAEWQNLQFFRAIGLPTARLVAYGEERGLVANRKAAIVTEEIPGTVDLASLSQSGGLGEPQWRRRVISRLAGHVRTMHGHHFVHNDLKWRNVLVEFSQDPEVYIIDCPLGRRLYGPMFSRGVIKDLACLDKVARYTVSRSDRLRFYKQYRGIARIGREDSRRIRKVLEFFDGRE